jgi:hypothetical protein
MTARSHTDATVEYYWELFLKGYLSDDAECRQEFDAKLNRKQRRELDAKVRRQRSSGYK